MTKVIFKNEIMMTEDSTATVFFLYIIKMTENRKEVSDNA